MLKTDTVHDKMRHELFKTFSEREISYATRVEMAEYMNGKTDEEKEKIAEQFLEIILASDTEEEIVNKIKTLKQT